MSIARRKLAFSMLVLLMMCSLSGCVAPENQAVIEPDLGNEAPAAEPYTLSTTCIDLDDVERCWLLLVPSNLSVDTAVPLVLDLHGYGGSGERQLNLSSFADLAVSEGFIVAYPDGHDNFWGLGFNGLDNDVDDIGFLNAVIESVSASYPIDASRVHMTGWSNGCKMTQRFIVEGPDVLASAGCMAGYLMTDAPSTYTAPIPFMEVHGVLDATVLYADNSWTAPFFQDDAGVNKGAVQNLETWGDINGCSGVSPEFFTQNAEYDIRGYSDCASGAEVRLMSLYTVGHNPYLSGTGDGPPSSKIVWEFMAQFSKI